MGVNLCTRWCLLLSRPAWIWETRW